MEVFLKLLIFLYLSIVYQSKNDKRVLTCYNAYEVFESSISVYR